jgi:hypothetical protein
MYISCNGTSFTVNLYNDRACADSESTLVIPPISCYNGDPDEDYISQYCVTGDALPSDNPTAVPSAAPSNATIVSAGSSDGSAVTDIAIIVGPIVAGVVVLCIVAYFCFRTKRNQFEAKVLPK